MTNSVGFERRLRSPGQGKADAVAREPKEAFRYRPPDAGMRSKYAEVFSLKNPPKERWIKLSFDKIFSLVSLTATLPIFCGIYASHIAISLFIPDQRGRLIVSYRAVSRGKVFPKYKFRVIKKASIDKALAMRGDWHAYAAEWSPESRTRLGVILKKFYLDELPQLFNILLGHMSVVGPRPLAEHHYERDLAQGNVHRKLIKAGLLGPTQSLKGTDGFGNPAGEYDYVDKYLKLPAPALLWYDVKLIGRCLRIVAQAKGL